MYSLLTEPVPRLSLVRSGLLPQARPFKEDTVPDCSLCCPRTNVFAVTQVA
jgi:hypothetical protein